MAPSGMGKKSFWDGPFQVSMLHSHQPELNPLLPFHRMRDQSWEHWGPLNP